MRRLSLKRRFVYISIIYLGFLLILIAAEIGTRLTLPRVSSLDLFVATRQQKAQVAKPSSIRSTCERRLV